MTISAVENFLNKLGKDKVLQAKLAQAPQIQQTNSDDELSDGDLEAVAGGFSNWFDFDDIPEGSYSYSSSSSSNYSYSSSNSSGFSRSSGSTTVNGEVVDEWDDFFSW